MQRYFKKVLIGLVGILIVMLLIVTYQQADALVHHPIDKRKPAKNYPQNLGLLVEEVSIFNADGQKLHGYFSNTKNGAYVMLQHGFKASRGHMLEEAKILQDEGFGLLVTSIRAHDLNDGDQITFGVREVDDIKAWHSYLLEQKDAQASKVGFLGNSMGAAIGLAYAAQNKNLAAVIAVSPFSSLQDTINESVVYFTGLPAFPFANMIARWSEQILDMDMEQVDSTRAAALLCDTPLLIMQGGEDIVVSVESGQRIYDAACGEKELWLEQTLGHAEFDSKMPQEFKRRVVDFFTRHLL